MKVPTEEHSQERHLVAPIYGSVVALTVIMIAWIAPPEDADTLLTAILGCWLLALAWVDTKTMTLPDNLTLPLLLVGLSITYIFMPYAVLDHVAGCVAGFSVLRVAAWMFRRLRGYDGLGSGDARLLGSGGAWIGWQPLAWVLLTASLLGITLYLAGRLRGRTIAATTPMPFGPPLCLAIWIQWLLQHL